MPRRPGWRSSLAFLAALVYLASIWRASAGLLNEDWDGIKTINNALLVTRAAAPAIPLDLQRAPLGWLPMAPALAWAYHAGGAALALAVAHRLWPLYLVALLACSWRLFRSLYSPGVALALVALMAANPILIQFAPFALLDIFGGLAALAFVWAARAYLEKPDERGLRVLALAALAAFLSKFHLGLLVAGVLAAAASSKKRRALLPRLCVLPVVCGLGGLGVLALTTRWVYGGTHPAVAEAWRELARDFSFNLLTPKQSDWTLYPAALWSQLGPGLAALGALGAFAWLRQDRDDGSFFTAMLAVPYLGLALISNKEARYAIPLLPLVYLAVGRGLEYARERLGTEPGRVAALAAALLLAPWARSLAAVRYLESEPSVHTSMPWQLGALAESLAGPAGCVAWRRGDLELPISDPQFRYEHALVIGAPTFQFFTRARVVETGEGKTDCAATIVPEARGAAIAKIEDGRGAQTWKVYPDRVAKLR